MKTFNTKNYILLLSFVFFIQHMAHSQSYSLDDCIRIATEQNLRVKQAKNQEQQSHLSLRQSKMGRLPSLNFGTSFGESFGRSVDPTTNQFRSQNFSSSYSNLSSSINLFNGFRRKYEIDLAQSNLKTNNLQTKLVEWEIRQLATQYYFQYWLTQEKLHAVQEAIKLDVENISYISTMVKAGKLAKLDLLQAKEQLIQDSNQHTTLSIEKTNTLNDLKTILSIPLKDDIALLKPKDDLISHREMNEKLAIEKGYQNHPSLLAQKQQIESSKLELKLNQSRAYPSLDVGVNVGSNFSSLALQSNSEVIPYAQQMETNLRTNAFINFQIPILTNNNNKIQRDISRFQIKNEETKLKALEFDIQRNVNKAYAELDLAKQTYERHKLLLDNSNEMYKQAKYRFDLGVINTYQFLEIKNKYQTAQVQNVELRYNYFFKKEMLDCYLDYIK